MRRSRSLQLAPSQPEVDEACYAQQPLARKKQPSTSQPPAGHDHQEEPDKQLDFLSRLPIELALYILLKLAQHNDPRHLLSARAVSKSWQRLAEDSLIWKQSFLSQPTWTITTTTTNNNHHHHQPPIPRRLSQLIGLAQPTPHWTATSEAAPQLNWLKLFRDRYIIDRRWRHGSQLSKKLKGHKDSVYCLQMHDQQIITGSRDRTIKVWDSRSRECQRTLLGHKGSVLCVRFDAELLLSGSSDSSVFVWDRASWTVVRELVGHRSGVLDLGLTSTVFVSCSKDTTIKIWNRPDGALLRTITGHTGPVNALELSLQPLATLLNQPDPSPSSPPLSNALLSASGDSSMKLWDTHSGLLIRTFDGHLRGLACLKLVEHLRQIITGSNDETIKIWNVLTGQCLRTLLGHSGLVRSLDFSLRHNRLVSGSYDKTIKVWDLATGQLLLDFRKGTDRSLVFDVKFNLTSIVFVGHPNSIMLLDFADGLEADMFD